MLGAPRSLPKAQAHPQGPRNRSFGVFAVTGTPAVLGGILRIGLDRVERFAARGRWRPGLAK
jgi:hypothetical protein